MNKNLTDLLQGYKQQMDDDFHKEWPKQRFKWFFKKRRQKKLRSKIFRRYQVDIFSITHDWIQDEVDRILNESIANLVDIKDVPYGDKAYFMGENEENV